MTDPILRNPGGLRAALLSSAFTTAYLAAGLLPVHAVTYANGENNSTPLVAPVSLDVAGSDFATQSGEISGSGAITKTGDGSLVLAAANTYSGGTLIQQGTLSVSSAALLGSGPVTLGAPAGNAAPASLKLSGSWNLSSAIVLHPASASARQSIELSGTIAQSGTISGSGGLFLNGNGTFQVGSGNTYAGGTTISRGVLKIASDSSFGAAGTEVKIQGGGTLEVNGSFTSNRKVSINDGEIDTRNSSSLTLTGEVSGTDFQKDGSGVLDLSSASGSFGGTLFCWGTLIVGSNYTGGGKLDLYGTLRTVAGFTVPAAYFSSATLDVIDAEDTVTVTGSVNGYSTTRFTKSGAGTVVLAGATNTDLNGELWITGGKLELPANNGYVTNGQNLLLSGGATLKTTGNFSTGRAVSLNTGGGIFEVSAAADLASYSGNVNGVGGLTKIGAGTLALTSTGTNTYSGGTLIQQGTLLVSSAGLLGSGPVTLGAPAGNAPPVSLKLSGSWSLNSAIVLHAASASARQSVEVPSGWITQSGTISGSGGLFLNGNGTFVVGSGNTYVGGTTISGGGLRIRSDSSLGAAGTEVRIQGGGDLVVNGSFTSNRKVSINNGKIDTQTSSLLTLTGEVSGTNFQKDGSGVLDLSAASGSFGGTLFCWGTLILGSNYTGGGKMDLYGTLRTGAGFTVPTALLSSATLDVVDAADTVTVTGGVSGSNRFTKSGAGTVVLAGATNTGLNGELWVTGGKLELPANNGYVTSWQNLLLSGGATLKTTGNFSTGRAVSLNTGGGIFDVSAAADLASYSGSVSGVGGLTKGGAGTLVLGADGLYTGPTAINGGTLKLEGSSETTRFDIAAGARLEFSTAAELTIYSGIVDGIGSLTKSGAGMLELGADGLYTGTTAINGGSLKLGGNSKTPRFDIAAGATLEFSVPSGDRAYQPQGGTVTIAGTGTLVKTGGGDARWTGETAIFELASGSKIDVQGGTLVGGSFGNEVWTNNKADLNVAGGALFNGVEANVRVNALTGTGMIRSGFDNNQTFSFGVDNGSGVFNGVLADNAGGLKANYVKVGSGTQILNGACTHTGTMTVNAGVLGGNGSLMSPMTIAVGGTIAPGNSTGTFTAGATTIAGSYACEINGTSADKLVVNGALTIQPGAVLDFNVLTAPTAAVYVIATYATLSGTFNVQDLPAGYVLNYSYDDGTSSPNIALVTTDPFVQWMAAYPSIPENQRGPGDDPDGDGDSNAMEFVLGGSPASGSSRAKVYTLIEDGSADGDTVKELVLTIAVRSGTPVFSGSPSPAATKDGYTCTVLGSRTLASFASGVAVVGPVTGGLPAVPVGYEYRSFSLDGTNGSPESGYFRVAVTP